MRVQQKQVNMVKILQAAFKRFTEYEALYAYKTLGHYLEMSRHWRNKENRHQLFLNHIEPHKHVSTSTMARWTKTKKKLTKNCAGNRY